MKLTACLLAAGSLMATPVFATTYTATVTGIVGEGPNGLAPIVDKRGYFTGASVGDTITTSYYYDRDKLIAFYNTHSPDTGQFFAFTKAVVTIGNNVLSLDSNGYYDYYAFRQETDFAGRAIQTLNMQYNVYPGAGEVIYAGANIYGLRDSIFSSVNNVLLSDYLDIELSQIGNSYFPSGGIGGGDQAGNSFLSIGYRATRFTVASAVVAVPEPASWVMMILGMGFVGYAMRHRRTVHFTHASA